MSAAPEGGNIRNIRQDSVRACPWIIFDPKHYRTNGTCRCDDPEHSEMKEWGYVWDGKAWIAGPEDES